MCSVVTKHRVWPTTLTCASNLTRCVYSSRTQYTAPLDVCFCWYTAPLDLCFCWYTAPLDVCFCWNSSSRCVLLLVHRSSRCVLLLVQLLSMCASAGTQILSMCASAGTQILSCRHFLTPRSSSCLSGVGLPSSIYSYSLNITLCPTLIVSSVSVDVKRHRRRYTSFCKSS